MVLKKKTENHTKLSGQIIIFHQPRGPISLTLLNHHLGEIGRVRSRANLTMPHLQDDRKSDLVAKKKP